MSVLFLAFFIGLGVPSGPLAEVVGCYEELDYECADEALAKVLLEPLDNETMVQARVYDALLGTAWRDRRRVRRAVRIIYGINPEFKPSKLPPAVMDIFEAERPAPPPPPEVRLSFDYAHVTVFDAERDAAWWQNGVGLNVSAGVRLAARYELALDFRAVQHLPESDREGLLNLDQYTVDLRGGLGHSLGRVSVYGGALLGASWTVPTIDPYYDRSASSEANDPFIATRLGAWLAIDVALWQGLGLGVRVSPELIIRTWKEQPHVSYFLPMMLGVRYGR